MSWELHVYDTRCATKQQKRTCVSRCRPSISRSMKNTKIAWLRDDEGFASVAAVDLRECLNIYCCL